MENVSKNFSTMRLWVEHTEKNWKILFKFEKSCSNLENLSIDMENFSKKLDTMRLWVEHMAQNFENPIKQAWE